MQNLYKVKWKLVVEFCLNIKQYVMDKMLL